MRLIKLSFLLLFAGDLSVAGDVFPTIPLTQNPTYTEAVSKAESALYAQTGLDANAKKVVDYGSARALHVLQDLGIDRPVGATLWLGRAVYRRDANFPVTHNVRIDVQPSQLSTTIKIEF